MEEMRGTTICAVKKNGQTAIAGDGQVTLSQSVIFKNNAVKVRRIYNDKVIFGFAGSVADAFSLSERFEEMLNKFSGNLMRSAVELAEQWRKGMANKLEAMMITADESTLLIVSGSGEVIEPEGSFIGLGKAVADEAAWYAGKTADAELAAAFKRVADEALEQTNDSAEEIAYKALKIASEICVFTNDHITCEVL